VLCALPGITAALPVPGSALSAQTLRARILASARLPYQGYAESTVDLGLPVLPGLQSVTRLFDGTTDQYVWYRSPGHWRADGLTAAGENDVYQVCQVTYQWNYSHNLLTRIVGAQPARLPGQPTCCRQRWPGGWWLWRARRTGSPGFLRRGLPG
jgi:hypothetical protein